ncbi:MAG: DUF3137 domain-containing protein [SAR324 cluster bacterium]|nr:DUF3137 domain-containing protein [SAR324 cluster bacterium]
MDAYLNFKDFFEEKLRKHVAELEAMRKKLMPGVILKVILSFVITAVLCALVIFLLMKVNTTLSTIALFVTFGLVYYIPSETFSKVTSSYKKKYKTEIVSESLKSISTHFKYFPNILFDTNIKKLFKNSWIFEHVSEEVNEINCSDLIIFDNLIDQIVVCCEFEGNIAPFTSKGKERVFDGVLGFATIGDSFIKRIVIKSKYWDKERSFGALPAKTFARFAKKSNILSQVDFADPDFDHIFDVYATDPADTLNLISPQFRKALIQLNTKLNEETHFSIADGYLYFTFKSKGNNFIPPIFSSVNIQQVKKDFEILEVVSNLVSYLGIKPIHDNTQSLNSARLFSQDLIEDAK